MKSNELVLSVEIVNVYLGSQSKNEHLLSLQILVCVIDYKYFYVVFQSDQ